MHVQSIIGDVVRGREEFNVLRGEFSVKPPAGDASNDLSISYTQTDTQTDTQAGTQAGRQGVKDQAAKAG